TMEVRGAAATGQLLIKRKVVADETYLRLYWGLAANLKGMLDLLERKRKADHVLLTQSFDKWESCIVSFSGDLCVVSSGLVGAAVDTSGTRLQDLWDFDQPQQIVSHSLVATKEGGALVFSWPSET